MEWSVIAVSVISSVITGIILYHIDAKNHKKKKNIKKDDK